VIAAKSAARRSDDGRYRLGAILGKGALAEVVALEGPDGRALAGKLLHASQGDDAGAVARFIQEAALLRRLDHPNLVRVEETVTVGGRPMLVMERIDGPTLAQRLAREGALGEPEIAALGLGIAAGLAHAHARGIIHRDLKPSNILLAGERTPKISDFGMARASSLAGVDRLGLAAVGTPDYMAPESLDPLAIDPRSDLYALGCILFELASGRPPYGAATPMGLLYAHRSEAIPTPPARLSAGLSGLIVGLLQKSPADRPPSAEAVMAALEELARPQGALAQVGAEGPRCTRCAAPLLPFLSTCLSCGQRTLVVEAGGATVLVVGPGGIGDKLDVWQRDGLVGWLAGNPGLGLDAGPLTRKIPRLPFTLARGVSAACGAAMVASLEGIGVEAEVVRGQVLGHKGMRKKAGTLSGRVLAIVAASMGGMMSSIGKVIFLLPVIVIGVVVGATVHATRRTTRRLKSAPAPRGLEGPLKAVEAVAAAIEAPRHRHGLRAVVHRAVALAEDRRFEGEAGEELAQAISAAAAAAGRLDALDRELGALDLHDEATRGRLLERDTWAARLLALTGALDALQARAAAASAAGERGHAGRLEELRGRVAAIAEVEAALRGEPNFLALGAGDEGP
jgi:hypothetical protein